MLKKQYSKKAAICKVTFTLPLEAIPGAKQVNILGDFNDWNPALAIPMTKLKGGYKAVLELATGKSYQFRYLGDNGCWENDWAADNYIAAPYNVDNSVLVLEETATVVPVQKTSSKANASSDTKLESTGIALSLASTVKKDDLKKIEGIGPKIAGLLNDAGIFTFADLSEAPLQNLKAILEAAGSRYKMHNPTTWSQQAALAAAGQWERLAKLQVELDGGKVK